MIPTLRQCFSFYEAGDGTCSICAAARRCRAVTITNGYDILADLVDQMVRELPDARYTETESVNTWVSELMYPPEITVADGAGMTLPTEPDIDV